MISSLIATAFICGILAMVFWTPATFARGIFTMEYAELSGREKVVTKIPVVNVIMAEHIYTGRISMVGIGTAAVIVMFCVRFLCVFLFPSAYVLQLVTVVLFLVSVVGFMLTNMILIWMVLTDTDVTSFFTKVALAVVFPLGQYYVGNFLPTVIKNMGKEEETFK